jgi:hypothetical protein
MTINPNLMKTFYIIAIIFSTCGNCTAQPFILLSNDSQGDVMSIASMDLKSLSYRMDVAQDSIWFKVETFNPVDPNGDLGMMFGFDTNNIVTDGIHWNGQNSSMNYDQSLLVFQDVMSPNYYGMTYNSGGSGWVTIDVQRPDSFTFIIRSPLSPLDSDGIFNLIFGAGTFDIISNRDIYDDLPEANYFSISPTTGVKELEKTLKHVNIFPNPASKYLHASISEKSFLADSYIIYSSYGTEIQKGKYESGYSIDITNLKTGMYFLTLKSGSQSSHCSVFTKSE